MNTQSKFTFFIFILIVASISFNIVQYYKQKQHDIEHHNTIIDTVYQNVITVDTTYINIEKTIIDTFTITDTIFITKDSTDYESVFNKTYIDTFNFEDEILDSLSTFNISMNIKHFSKMSLLANSNYQIKMSHTGNFIIENLVLSTTIKERRPTIPTIQKHQLFVFSNFGIRTDNKQSVFLLSPSLGILYNKDRMLYGANIGMNRMCINIGWKLW